MLCNLQELQINLEALIGEFKDIRDRLINPIEAKKTNNQTLLLKMPKIILLIRICPFLKTEDIINLSSSSSSMRRIIYSPIGWKILNIVKTPYPIYYKQIIAFNQSENYHAHVNQRENYEVHMIEDVKLLTKIRQQCKKSLMQLFEKFRLKEEEYNELVGRVKTEKTHVAKLKNLKTFLEEKRNRLREQNNKYKEQLKAINEGFDDKMAQMDKVNDQIEKEKIKLQNQKEALVGRVRQYQNQLEVLKYDAQKSKLVLKKIKNYLFLKEL